MRNPACLFSLAVVARWAAATLEIPTQQQPLLSPPLHDSDHGDSSSSTSLPFSTVAFEEYIDGVMERWHAPGMAVAMINGNDTYAKGFGLASLDPPVDVTPHTLFFMGSTSKSFTAASLSLLVDNSSDYAGVQWDTPISQLLREDFVLSDDWATAHITIEDALSHRTGYPRHDLSIGNDTAKLVRSFRHLPMSAEPRTKFQYNNMMYDTAGYLIEKLTGLKLGTFFHRYLWAPMGMNETFLSTYDPLLKTVGSNLTVASGYWWVNHSSTYVRMPDPGPTLKGDEGAGGVVSNVLDYTKYLRVMMAEQGPVSAAGHRELKRPRTFYDHTTELFAPAPVHYGLAWAGAVFEGEMVYFHTGQISTFMTFMATVPSRGYGVVLVANSNSRVRELVMYRALYDLLGVDEGRRRDFEAQYRREEEVAREALLSCPERVYPEVPSPPIPASVPLSSHTGHYIHPAYGSVFVGLECDEKKATLSSSAPHDDDGCGLVLSRGPEAQEQFGTSLEHKTGDFWLGYMFLEETPDVVQGCFRTEFRVDARGIVTHVGIDLRIEEVGAPLVWFERVGL